MPLNVLYKLILSGVIFLTGCAERYVSQRSTEELIELAGDRGQADRVRLAVLEEVWARPLDGEQQRILGEKLAGVAKSPLHSPVVRGRVVDIIATKYPGEASLWLSEALIETGESGIRGRILGHLEQFGDLRALPGLIIALSMPTLREGMPPADPPTPGVGTVPRQKIEGVISRIANDSVERVLASYLLDPEDNTLRGRTAALRSLMRLQGEEAVQQILSLGGEGDVFLAPLRFWAEEFDYVPETQSEILMCQLQWLQLTTEQKEELEQRARLLQERERYTFEIADSYILLEAEKRLVARSGDRLRSAIGQRLYSAAHTKRPASYRGAADDYREDFVGQVRELSYTDLLRIHVLLESLGSEPFIEQLQRYLQEDMRAEATEVGGLSFLQAGRVAFKAYPPVERRGDNQYHESAEMIADGVYCLARWHCHADTHQERTDQGAVQERRSGVPGAGGVFSSGRWRGAALAGPGVDDMGYVQYFRCPLLVVTYIDRETLNLDYVSGGGIVVDLGNY